MAKVKTQLVLVFFDDAVGIKLSSILHLADIRRGLDLESSVLRSVLPTL